MFARIIRQAPEHLRPGGRLHCLTFATDRRDGDLEQRVRQWLGPAESDFDVFVVALRYHKRPDRILDNIAQGRERPANGRVK